MKSFIIHPNGLCDFTLVVSDAAFYFTGTNFMKLVQPTLITATVQPEDIITEVFFGRGEMRIITEGGREIYVQDIYLNNSELYIERS